MLRSGVHSAFRIEDLQRTDQSLTVVSIISNVHPLVSVAASEFQPTNGPGSTHPPEFERSGRNTHEQPKGV